MAHNPNIYTYDVGDMVVFMFYSYTKYYFINCKGMIFSCCFSPFYSYWNCRFYHELYKDIVNNILTKGGKTMTDLLL